VGAHSKAIEFPQIDQFAAEMDEFAQCIMQKKTSAVSGEEGRRDVALMMAIYDSARSGKAIDLRSS
jgi:predicted dehydrogenase